MSILMKWKNKLQDPSSSSTATTATSSSSYETRIREFDERVSLLKTENVELHKRIDQLEALCTTTTTTSVDTHQQTRSLQDHVRQLEEENGRLSTENQCQRQEYERFLDQLTSMILRTAAMQENIRKECSSIYHVIERLSTLTASAIQDKRFEPVGHRAKRLRSLSWENLSQPCELLTNYQLLSTSPKTTAELIRHLCQHRSSLSSSSSSSCSSTTTHCSFSTSGSWTLDLSFYDKTSKVASPILPIPDQSATESLPAEQDDAPAGLQRSETFIVGKVPEEDVSTSPEKLTMTVHDRHVNSNVQRCSTTRAMASTTSTVIRPSRLPSRCSTNRSSNTGNALASKTSSSTHSNTRSLSAKKVSKLPIRTPTSASKDVASGRKSTVATSVTAKTKKDSTVASNRSMSSTQNHSATKKPTRPSIIANSSMAPTSTSSKARSRSTNMIDNKHPAASTSLPLNKRTRTIPPVVKKTVAEPTGSSKRLVKSLEEKSTEPIEQLNSTSSESSIEENQRRKKLLSFVQDEGYATWSSSDVKDELATKNLKKTATDERRRNTGLVKNWLDTSNRSCLKKPVKEVEIDKLAEFSRDLSDGPSILCPFVRNRCSNGIIIPLASTTLSSAPLPASLTSKDISVDSLDGAAHSPLKGEQQPATASLSSSSSSSSSTFSRSETFEKVHLQRTLPYTSDDLADSTDSTCSDLNQLCNMSEYIEDHFLDQEDRSSSSFSRTILPKSRSAKPQKRLLFPGLFNRLIFLRRVLSDSDLRQKVCCIGESEAQFHVYHSNTINEHSIELNLMNTYGSESELHVWSHDCAEQRRFASERQQQAILRSNQSQSKLSHIERMIRMSLDDRTEEEAHIYPSDNADYDQQLALERQNLLQQIYEYPWLLQDDDIDQVTVFSSPISDQPLSSPSPDLVVPSHNPDFYQLCALTNSSSFATSYGTNSRHTTPPIAPSVL